MTKRLWLFISLFMFTPLAFGAQARSLPLDVLENRLPKLRFIEEDLKFHASPEGSDLNAKLLVPDQVIEARLPVLLVFGGFEEAGKVLTLIHPDTPMLVASFDYPFSPPRKFIFPDSLRFAPQAKHAIHETLAGIEELCKELRKRKDVDPARITLVGASFGAPFALAVAARDPEITGVVIVHGFGDIPGTVRHQILRRWEPKWGSFARPAAWLLANIGWWYLKAPAPEDSARELSSRQNVLMIDASADTFIPRESTEALWKALEESQSRHERITMEGDHLQPGATALIDKLTAIVSTWMKKVSLR